jgi:hypothetical protein
MAVYISDVQMGPQGPSIRGGATFRIGEDGAKLKAKIEELSKTLPPQMIQTVEIGGETFQTITAEPNAKLAGNTLTWGFNKKYFLVTLGEGEMELLLKRAGGKAPGWLVKIRQDLPVERVSTVGFLNVKALVKIFVPMAGPQAAVALEALGVSKISNITSVAGLDQSNYISKIHISIDGEPQGVMQLASIKPLSAADLASIPADATQALAVKINPAAVFDAYWQMGAKLDPQQTAVIRHNLDVIESQWGLKIPQDILSPLGDAATLYTKSNMGGIPEMILAVQVKDYQQAVKTQETLVRVFQPILDEMAKTVPTAPKLRKDKVAGKESYLLEIHQPGVPSIYWCLTEKELIVSMTGIQGVQTYLSRPADFKSLAQSPEVAKLFTGGGGPTAVFYWNMQQTFEQIYPMLPMIAPLMQQRGIGLDLSMLPPQQAIGPHLTPLVTSIRRTKSGIEITERSPLPGLGITQSAPIAAALLLSVRAGSMTTSSEAAQRAASINNMKQIMLAMHNYHDANKRFPPAFKADKEGKPLLSWRVLILPMMEQGELYNQFHLDEPWDSENNKKLIAKMPPEFKSPNSKAGEGRTNYLAVRGEKAMFPGKQGVRIADITDGTAHTIAIVEASDEKAAIWTKPDDFEYSEENPLQGLVGMHPNVFLAGFADGSIRLIPTSIDPQVLKALFTRNGGEVVPNGY